MVAKAMGTMVITEVISRDVFRFPPVKMENTVWRYTIGLPMTGAVRTGVQSMMPRIAANR